MCEYPCERLHLTHKWLIDEAKKHYPDKKVLLGVYAPVRTPSRKFDYYGDNVILEICGEPNALKFGMWKGKAPATSVYTFWFDVMVGLGMDRGKTPLEISRKVRFLVENDVVGIYLGGGGSNWGFMGPTYYVMCRMCSDPSLDYRALFAEYCEGLYGNAAAAMQEFFELLYTRLTMKQPGGATYEDMQILRYTPEFLSQLEALLVKAEAAADTERSKNFIVMTRHQFDFNKLLTRAFLAYRAYQINPTAPNWQHVRDAVIAFDEFRERVVRLGNDFTARWYPGYSKFFNYLTSNGDKKLYYKGWASRKEAVLSKPLRGVAVGYWQSLVRIPLTLDLDHPPDVPKATPGATGDAQGGIPGP